MPAYDYTCPKCGWKGTRYHVPVDERDAQQCECTQGDDPPCGSELTRDEIADTQARMGHQWSRWST